MKPINGERLKTWRIERNMTLESLAHELNVSYTTVARWERNKNKRGVSPLAYERLQRVGFAP